jgi:hypothetical protein
MVWAGFDPCRNWTGRRLVSDGRRRRRALQKKRLSLWRASLGWIGILLCLALEQTHKSLLAGIGLREHGHAGLLQDLVASEL